MRLSATTLALLAVLAVLAAGMASAVRASRGVGTAAGARVAAPARTGAPVRTAAPAHTVAPAAGAFAPALTGPTGILPGLVAPPVTPSPRPAVVTAITPITPAAPSRALGAPNHGRLVRGVLLPEEGADHVTWDAIEHVSANRDWRRVGTDRLVARILAVAARFRRAHPGAPRLVVSDLSLPEGGHFGSEYGGLGHASHQNGLDVDIAYPRVDRREIGVTRVAEIDQRLAQSLVNAWVAAGAQFVFVGPHTGLRGPRAIVQPLADHDDHMHVRIPNADD